jgi:glycosyltransferase involved in cell wall biosynthesis
MRTAGQHDIGTLVLNRSTPAYSLLPRISAARPDLRIVAFQFNAVECIAENRRYAAHIDMVIAESADAARVLTGGGTRAVPFNIIPSGIDVQAFASRPRARRRDGRICIGFVGRFDRVKNPAGFVRTVAALGPRPFRYVMAGDGALPRKIDTLARSLGIEMLGLLSDDALQDLMDEIDILIVPSHIDGRPLIIQEAHARRIAVVASRVGGIPELIQDGVTGFLRDCEDYDGFARAALRLAEDDDLRVGIVEAGLRRVLEEGDIADALPRYAAAITGEAQASADAASASRRCA